MISVDVVDAKNGTELELFTAADAQTFDEVVQYASLFCFKHEFRGHITAAGVEIVVETPKLFFVVVHRAYVADVLVPQRQQVFGSETATLDMVHAHAGEFGGDAGHQHDR